MWFVPIAFGIGGGARILNGGGGGARMLDVISWMDEPHGLLRGASIDDEDWEGNIHDGAAPRTY